MSLKVLALEERVDKLEDQVAKLTAALLPQPSIAPAPFYDYDPATRTVQLAAYDEIVSDPEVAALVARQKAREAEGTLTVPLCGPRFMVEAAIAAFGVGEPDAFVIRRSCAQAGADFNIGRWCFADATSDEKLPGCTAIRADEDPRAVILALLDYARRDEASGVDTKLPVSNDAE